MTLEIFYLSPDSDSELCLHHMPPKHDICDKAISLLYIHGATFPSALSIGFKLDGYSWMDNLADSGFNVWALDFIGYGASARYNPMPRAEREGEPYGHCEQAVEQINCAIDFIRDHDNVEKVSMIAHSWGTIPAARFAGENPARVDRLVLFGPITKRDGQQDANTQTETRLVTINEQYARFTEDVPPGRAAVLQMKHFDEWAKGYLASDPDSYNYDPPAVRVPSGPATDIHKAWSVQLPYDPATITAPTMIVRGEWDSLCTDDDARWLFDALENAPVRHDVKISAATHLMHLEDGRFELYEATRAFLSVLAVKPDEPKNRPAIAMIFEVEPYPEHKEKYLDITANLRAELERIDGFISIERFESLTINNKILSLSFFRDEQAIAEWRNLQVHRAAQNAGKETLFKEYRLRIAEVVRDYGKNDREQASPDSREAFLK